jgi:hypothetical protein
LRSGYHRAGSIAPLDQSSENASLAAFGKGGIGGFIFRTSSARRKPPSRSVIISEFSKDGGRRDANMTVPWVEFTPAPVLELPEFSELTRARIEPRGADLVAQTFVPEPYANVVATITFPDRFTTSPPFILL